MINPRNTFPAAPPRHPQTTYPQHNQQLLWGSGFCYVQKTIKNRDLLEDMFSRMRCAFSDRSAESPNFRGLQRTANTLSTEPPTEIVCKWTDARFGLWKSATLSVLEAKKSRRP
jgi:hypothetical protein